MQQKYAHHHKYRHRRHPLCHYVSFPSPYLSLFFYCTSAYTHAHVYRYNFSVKQYQPELIRYDVRNIGIGRKDQQGSLWLGGHFYKEGNRYMRWQLTLISCHAHFSSYRCARLKCLVLIQCTLTEPRKIELKK